MDIHKPKAAHSWREFAIEIATIIAGILIALALEQAVEAYHWSERVAEGRKELRAEVTDQTRIYTIRIAVHPCAERRLAEVEGILAELDAGRRVARVRDFGRPPGASVRENAWRALGASGALAHLPARELLDYSTLYSVSADITTWSLIGGQDWAVIKLVVGDPNRLTPADRSQIRVAINHTRAFEEAWTSAGKSQLDRARSLGIPIAPARDFSAVPECQPLQRG